MFVLYLFDIRLLVLHCYMICCWLCIVNAMNTALNWFPLSK